MIRAHELDYDPLAGMVISTIPDSIGKYEIQDTIGQGGMGIVYEAWDPNLKRVVALKVANPFLAGSKDWMRRFLEEARTLAQLDCDYVAKVNATGEDDGIAWVDMALVSGASLQDHVRTEGPRPVTETLDTLERVAQGLVETHRRKIVYRDLKPDNIIIHPDRGAVIIDFGIAHTATEWTSGAPTSLPEREGDLTTVAGTPDYASPEQRRFRRERVPQAYARGFHWSATSGSGERIQHCSDVGRGIRLDSGVMWRDTPSPALSPGRRSQTCEVGHVCSGYLPLVHVHARARRFQRHRFKPLIA